ncbi:MAG: hypothetical protein IKX95_07925 [Lachnospiraceae bacterium]|nr:hypothetical protein [Lachnospiraceae bacterium]MBR5766693.1 hypothetical protein [Lachnospiraceae bacterium]MBR6486453.1 hypothetical protein [Lachnospiraceae bacterium]
MKKLIIALFAVAIATVFAPAKEVKAAYNSLSAGAHAEMLRSFYNVPAYEKDFADKYNYLEQLKRDGAPASDISAAETALTNASVKLAQLNSLVSYQLTQSSSFPVTSTYVSTVINEPVYAALYANKSIYATALNNQAIYNSHLVNQAAYNAVLATNGAYAVDLANVAAYSAYYHGQAPYPR